MAKVCKMITNQLGSSLIKWSTLGLLEGPQVILKSKTDCETPTKLDELEYELNTYAYSDCDQTIFVSGFSTLA